MSLKRVPGVYGKKGLERGFQKRLAKGWRKFGEWLAQDWRRVGEGLADFPALSNSEFPRRPFRDTGLWLNGFLGEGCHSWRFPSPLPAMASYQMMGGPKPLFWGGVSFVTLNFSSPLIYSADHRPTNSLPPRISVKRSWAYTRKRLQQQNPALPPQTLPPPMGGVSGFNGVNSVAAPRFGTTSAAGAAYPAFASPSPRTPASALPQTQPFAHGLPQATSADHFPSGGRSQLYQNSKSKEEIQQASLEQSMNACKRLLFVSTLGQHEQCNFGIMLLPQPALHTNNGHSWLLHKELCRLVCLLLDMLCLCGFHFLKPRCEQIFAIFASQMKSNL